MVSPVKIALAPAMKQNACSLSEYVCRPAANRMMVVGSTMRAVAIVRRIVACGRGCEARMKYSIGNQDNECAVNEQLHALGSSQGEFPRWAPAH